MFSSCMPLTLTRYSSSALFPFVFCGFLIKADIRENGTLIIMGLLGNLANWDPGRLQKRARALLLEALYSWQVKGFDCQAIEPVLQYLDHGFRF